MERIKQLLSSSLADFAGLAVFYALLYSLGLKAAIAGTIIFLMFDVVRRRHFGLGFPRLYILSGVLAVGFGIVDLASKNPFMIKYEAVVTSLVLAGMFAWGARGKSMIQELVEQRDGESYDSRPDFVRFFQLLTLVWAAYFVVKAAVYVWIGERVPMERLLEIRPFIGTGSMIAMVLLMTQGERIYRLCNRLGWLPRPAGSGDPQHAD